MVTLPNTVHVTSEGDDMLVAGASCARRVIRAFVRAPGKLQSLDARCAGHIPPVHTPGAYPASFADVPPATVLSGPDPGEDAQRAVTASRPARSATPGSAGTTRAPRRGPGPARRQLHDRPRW